MDQTTGDTGSARARAIEIVAAEMEAAGWVIDDDHPDERIVDALLARPEVLLELARGIRPRPGRPTSVSVSQTMGHVEAGSTIVGYSAP
ncbi:hypothetical protein ACU61A_15630 [Pseudonocardia sichuanensis]